MENYYMTSRQPYWCTKPFLREINYIFIQKSSFVLAAGHMSENALYIMNI